MQKNINLVKIIYLHRNSSRETNLFIYAKINAHKKQSCKIIEAENVKSLAEARSNAFKTKVLKEAEAFKEKCHIEADVQTQIIS